LFDFISNFSGSAVALGNKAYFINVLDVLESVVGFREAVVHTFHIAVGLLSVGNHLSAIP
jgi:hypothetical protein